VTLRRRRRVNESSSRAAYDLFCEVARRNGEEYEGREGVRGSTKEESPRSAITEVALHTGVVAFTALRHCTRYPGITHEHTDHVNTSKEKENKCPVPLNTGRENHHDCHVSLLFFPDSRRSSSNESRQATTRGRFASADDASSRLLKYVFFSLSSLAACSKSVKALLRE
jgi:hypothetical protein